MAGAKLAAFSSNYTLCIISPYLCRALRGSFKITGIEILDMSYVMNLDMIFQNGILKFGGFRNGN